MRTYDETTYERLMHSAAKLFARQGFDGTTTRQIVADAGSSLSSLQTHFQSKESLYQAVLQRTLDTFYKLNGPIMDEIRLAEEQGFLNADMAWNFIVQMTSQVIEWAFNETYRDEIILINREILMSDDNGQELPQSIFGLYNLIEKLFEVYTGQKDQFWLKALTFSLITSAFDVANYPRLLNRFLNCDTREPENKIKLKAYMKGYLLTCVKASLNAHGIE